MDFGENNRNNNICINKLEKNLNGQKANLIVKVNTLNVTNFHKT